MVGASCLEVFNVPCRITVKDKYVLGTCDSSQEKHSVHGTYGLCTFWTSELTYDQPLIGSCSFPCRKFKIVAAYVFGKSILTMLKGNIKSANGKDKGY